MLLLSGDVGLHPIKTADSERGMEAKLPRRLWEFQPKVACGASTSLGLNLSATFQRILSCKRVPSNLGSLVPPLGGESVK